MIGDDLVNDVGGAQQCGIKGIQVRTGKYRSVMLCSEANEMYMFKIDLPFQAETDLWTFNIPCCLRKKLNVFSVVFIKLNSMSKVL